MVFRRSPASVNLRPGEHKGIQFSFAYIALFLVAIVAITAAYYFYTQYLSLGGSKEMQAQRLVSEVGEHILLPELEKPTIATVTDPKALEGQPFFAHAEAGDRVLVYPNAKKAILYRPGVHRIVEVMPFEAPIKTGQ